MRAGDSISASDAAGVDRATMKYAEGPFERSEQALANVKLALAASGADLRDVVRAWLFVPDPEDLPLVQPIVAKYFDGMDPTNTGISAPLAHDALHFDIEVAPNRPIMPEQSE